MRGGRRSGGRCRRRGSRRESAGGRAHAGEILDRLGMEPWRRFQERRRLRPRDRSVDAAHAHAPGHRGEGEMTVTRRDLVRNVLAAGAGMMLVPRIAWTQGGGHPARLEVDLRDPWASLPDLLARIVPPRIPRRDFVVKAKGDATGAIRKAIDA